jgi:hypothetical protein
MRRALVWLVAVLAVAAATGGLMWWTTATAARFEVDGDRLTVSGQLTLASTERLDRLLEEHGDLSTLVLGDISVADDVTTLLQKGTLIRSTGLSTEVSPGVTLTGDAVYLFLGGITRTLGADAGLAVDGWQTPAGAAARLPRDHPAHSERLDYVRRMLGAEDFYWFTLEAPGEMPHPMTPAEMRELGVVTD